MKKININLSNNRNYNIIIDTGYISNLESVQEYFAKYSKIMLVTNNTIFEIYGEKIINSFANIGKNISTSILSDGEEYKNLDTLNQVYTDCVKAGLDRKSLIVAFGGGVVGDIAGFAAASYMRGIDFVQVPTTLLAQVDSSVGGKTGVNHPMCKNMIGAFYQPQAVIIDIDVLNTLEDRQYIAGLAEVVKYGVILDQEFFEFLENNTDKILELNQETLQKIISRSCELKAEIVEKDETESGIRAILNYGHTIGHAIESVTDYKRYLHGEAIAIGMICASKIAVAKGLITEDVVTRQKVLLEKLGLPTEIEDLDAGEIVDVMKTDKKFVDGVMRFILPKRIGEVFICDDVTVDEVLSSGLPGLAG